MKSSLSKFPELYYIEGIHKDTKTSHVNLVLKRNLPQHGTKESSIPSGVSLEDLVIALKLRYDKKINAQIIGGALQPLDPLNSDTERLKKEFYPDYYINKQAIEGTKFAEVILEASKILTSIASGWNIQNRGDYLEKDGLFRQNEILKDLGINPIQPKIQIQQLKIPNNLLPTLSTVSSPNSSRSPTTATTKRIVLKNNNIQVVKKFASNAIPSSRDTKTIRLWLVVKSIKETDLSHPDFQFYSLPEIQLDLQASKTVLTPQGTLQEIPVDDPEDPIYIFAHKFTEKYSQISKMYPVFKKVEQMYRALRIADWMVNKNIPVDMVLLNNHYQKECQYISSPKEQVFRMSAIPSSRLITSPKKNIRIQIPDLIDPKDHVGTRLGSLHDENIMSSYSPRSARENKFTSMGNITEERLIGSPSVSTHRGSSLNIFGGILLNIITEKGDKGSAGKIQSAELQARETKHTLDGALRSTVMIDYPFQTTMCKTCENYLKYDEQLVAGDGNYYCRIHHPITCHRCFNVILANCLDVAGRKYHEACVLCHFCEKVINGKLVKVDDKFLHFKCSEEVLNAKDISLPLSKASNLVNKRGKGLKPPTKRTAVSFKGI